MKKITQIFTTTLLALTILSACSPQYRHRLYMTSELGRTALKPTELFYVEDVVVSSVFARDYARTGKGHIAAMAYPVKDSYKLVGEHGESLHFNARTDFRMILPLPARIIPGEIELDNTAFVRDFSTPDVPIADRTYLFASGTFAVDSIKSLILYASLDAVFRSLRGDSLKYDGQMKFLPRKEFTFRGTIYDRR